MTTNFTLSAKHTADVFTDEVAIGDAVPYRIDATPWQEDNATITAATWTVESGNVSVSGAALSSGIASALLTFNEVGKNVVSILLTTATAKKKIFLTIIARDASIRYADSDYGVDL